MTHLDADPARKPRDAVLFIDRSSSYCGACAQMADPHQAQHRTIPPGPTAEISARQRSGCDPTCRGARGWWKTPPAKGSRSNDDPTRRRPGRRTVRRGRRMTQPTAVVGTLFGVVLLWYLLQHAIDAAGERLGWWKRR